MFSENYFKFSLYGDSRGDIAEEGKYIFQNSNQKISKNSCLPFLVSHYVTKYNLSDLELFFKLAGFSAFTEQELPNSIVTPTYIGLPNRKNATSRFFGGYEDEDEAKKFIESELGEGIISRFRDLKIKQLSHQKNQLLEELRNIEQKLEIKDSTCVTNEQHQYTK